MSPDRPLSGAAFAGLSAPAWFWGACLAVVLGASALRFAGLAAELPFVHHPDEPVNLAIVQDMLRNGSANPKAFNYGSFFYYLHAPGQSLVWLLNGNLAPIASQMMGSVFAPQPEAFLIARAVSAAIGIGVVVATMALARDAGLRRAAIVFAGALAAINPLLAGHSRMIAPDVPAALFCALALIGAARVRAGGKTSAYLFAAVMTGLAASTKYNAGLVGLAIAVAHVRRDGFGLSRIGPLVLAGAVSIAAFLLTSPFAVLDWPNASAGILALMRHYSTGHPGFEGDTLRTNLLWLWGAFGIAVFLVVFSARHPARGNLLPLAVFAAAYFALISVQVVRFDRNLMPAVPPLIVLLAAGFEVFSGALRRWMPHARLRLAAAGTLAIALLSPGALQSLADTAERYVDPRKDVRDWIGQNIPPGTSVFVDAYAPYLDPAAYRVSATAFVLREPMEKIAAHDVAIVTQRGSGRFLDARYPDAIETLRQLEARACERKEFSNGGAAAFRVFRLRC